jgi:hypothetical protein
LWLCKTAMLFTLSESSAQGKENKVFAINAQIKKVKILFDYCAQKEYKCF